METSEDDDAIVQRLAAMEQDVLRREAAAEQKRQELLKQVEREEIQVRRHRLASIHVLKSELGFNQIELGLVQARMARKQFEQARRESLGHNQATDQTVRSQRRTKCCLPPCRLPTRV
jgi:hypothetical protein